MENGGGAGSAGAHFEKVVFGDEIMVSDEMLDARFSHLSLAVAADSGWYDVDFMDADEYNYGRDKGCQMFAKKCRRNVVSEFCNAIDDTKCSDNFKYISICKNSKYTGTCNINLNYRSCKRYRKSKEKAFKYGRRSICQNCQVSLKIPLTI
jgi:leishmanolysin